MITGLANHLWQSTMFCGVVALLMLILQKNRAAVRHRLWLAASMKFLIPFSLLVSITSHIEWRTTPAPVEMPASVLEQVSQPFASPAKSPLLVSAPRESSRLPGILFDLWLCGFATQVLAWWQRWRRVRAALRTASPMNLGLPIRAMSTPSQLEPGVFGIFRPILMLPEGITEHLTNAQFEMVLAHELCHVRRRDNLAAATHMVVETLFWFHPLVWWIRARLVEERERACDEEVLRAAADPQDYAEGIVAVCRYYLKSPSVFVSGVTGSNLKRRIEAIMCNRSAIRLNVTKRIVLSLAGAVALLVPLIVGLLNSPPIRAQSTAPSSQKFEVASIKPTGSKARNSAGVITLPGGHLSAENATVSMLMMRAYRVQDFQIAGGPAWIHDVGFDIDAKGDANVDRAQIMTMLQPLLEDRFQLKFHRETRELPVYALAVARGGAKLPAPKEGGCVKVDDTASPGPPGPTSPPPCGAMNMPVTPLGMSLRGSDLSMPELIRYLTMLLGRPVLDRTGITKHFDVNLDFSPDDMTSGLMAGWGSVQGHRETVAAAGAAAARNDPKAAPNILAAVQEQLGLKLESTKGQAEVIVIDHVEKPSEN